MLDVNNGPGPWASETPRAREGSRQQGGWWYSRGTHGAQSQEGGGELVADEATSTQVHVPALLVLLWQKHNAQQDVTPTAYTSVIIQRPPVIPPGDSGGLTLSRGQSIL